MKSTPLKKPAAKPVAKAAAAETAVAKPAAKVAPTKKIAALDPYRASPAGKTLTTNQGLPISDDQNSLRAGERGPTLLEDFILREKITHFDHERIPERVVHARGAAAHGYFQVYESLSDLTRAGFLQDPSVKTPVFVRFSTVGGSRGSADTPRDVRGFAVKFYTDEGNFDLVGNNMPVFFIQDAIKFPDLIHAVKPEPHNEIPQASSAHDTFWDFLSLTLESSHMAMWLMSDRSLPRSFANMEGFGVHTFRLINASDESRYVKFHWKPVLGTHSLVWDESQKLAGKDPDFHRRDMYESIDQGRPLEWELGLQVFGDEEADAFGFDILDSTKLVPEELVPVRRVGKLTLDRNPDSYFAETEQVAFCTTHLVPGIGFTNDPLLQGRNFSYLDTQLSRLGGPNFHEIPINRPVCPFSNGQRDGLHRMTIDTGDASYGQNSLDGDFPKELPKEEGGFATYPERVDGTMRKVRSASFGDHFSQATMFWNSMSDPEREHIVSAFAFELSKVERVEIRSRVLERMLANVDSDLATRVATLIGRPAPAAPAVTNGAATKAANGKANGTSAKRNGSTPAPSAATTLASPLLSQLHPETGVTGSARGRRVAILAADGADGAAIEEARREILAAGAIALVVSNRLGEIDGVKIDRTMTGMPSIAFDAVLVADGDASVAALRRDGDAVHYVAEAFKHLKALAAIGSGKELLERAGLPATSDPENGLVVADDAASAMPDFLTAIGKHRAWGRLDRELVPA